MIGLPKSTEYNHRIPKQKFYENIVISPQMKRVFIEQIRTIYWRNKIAATTLNLAQGEQVTEIEVFEIKLVKKIQPEQVLRQIDKAIPYHIVFLLVFEGRVQAWIAYKEISPGTKTCKVLSYYHTDWMTGTDLPLKLDGFNLDRVYESLVRQIGGKALTARNEEESLQQSVERDVKRQELQKQITALQAKVRREKQLNKQFQLNNELKRLKTIMEVQYD